MTRYKTARYGTSALYRDNSSLTRRAGGGLLRYTLPSASGPLGPNSQPGGPMMFDGDSLTYGVGVGGPGPNAYPNQTVALLGSDYTLAVNDGVAGETIVQINASAAANIDSLYDATKPQCWSLIWGGTNDIIGGATGSTIWSGTNGLRKYIRDRKATGFKVVVLTCLPRQEFADQPVILEPQRTALNGYIRDNVTAEGFILADIAADSRIGDLGDEQTSYYDTDHIHMSASGYAVVAGIVATAIRKQFGAT